ncbi:MAG: D-alanine--D-alanine ligase [Leptospiraceae bacterium]|nr:D-alanine--D-alanine ligase [Leptospiraceae bacterium]
MNPRLDLKEFEVVLLIDIYSEEINYLQNEYIQEWESRSSIQILEKTLVSLGARVKIFEPIFDKERMLKHLCKRIKENKQDKTIIWNLVEGFFSRNREGYVPSLAEFLGFPFCGSDASAMSISLDKNLTKKIAIELGIQTPRGILVQNRKEFISKIQFPVFLKPNGEGSSLGIKENSIIQDNTELRKSLTKAKKEFFPLLLEKFIEGTDLTLGIIQDRGRIIATNVYEVIIPNKVYSDEIKSKGVMTEKLVLWNDIKSKKIQLDTIKLAERLGVKGYARADWKLDKKGKPQFLEINLTPGLSLEYSSLPICYGKNKYSKLLKKILESALYEYNNSLSRKYGKLFTK